MNPSFQLKGRLVDILQRRIYPATVSVAEGHIQSITPMSIEGVPENIFIIPGFIDAHVHITALIETHA